MKINKKIWDDGDYYHYYEVTKTNDYIIHGLFNYYLTYGIGYRYHTERKGFCLRIKK